MTFNTKFIVLPLVFKKLQILTALFHFELSTKFSNFVKKKNVSVMVEIKAKTNKKVCYSYHAECSARAGSCIC